MINREGKLELRVWVPASWLRDLEAHVKRQDMSKTSWVKQACEEKMQREANE